MTAELHLDSRYEVPKTEKIMEPTSRVSRPKQPAPAPVPRKVSYTVTFVGWLAFLLGAGWVGLCLVYTADSMGFENLTRLMPYELGSFVVGLISVPAFIWIGFGNWQRLRSWRHTAEGLHQELSLISKTPVANPASAANVLRQQANALVEASHAALSSLQNAQTLLKEEVSGIERITTQSVEQFNGVGTNLAERFVFLEGLSGKLSGNAQNFGQQISASIAGLDKALERFDLIGHDLESRGDRLASIGQGVAERLSENNQRTEARLTELSLLTTDFGKQREDLEVATGQMSETVKRSADTILDRIYAMNTASRSVAETIEHAVSRTHDMERLAAERIADLTSLGTVAVQRTEEMRNALSAGARDVADLSSNIANDTQIASEQLTTRVQILQQTGDALARQSQEIIRHTNEASQYLTSVGDKLTHHQNALEETTRNVSSQIDQMGDKLGGNLASVQQINQAVAVGFENLQSALDRAQGEQHLTIRNLGTLQETLGVTTDHFKTLRNNVLSDSQDIQNAADMVAARAATISGQLQQQTESFARGVSSALQEAEKAGESLNQTGATILSNTQTIGAAFETLRTNAGALDQSMQAIEQKTLTVQAASAEVSERIRQTTDAIEQARQSMQASAMQMGEHLGQLAARVGDSLARLEGGSDTTAKKLNDIYTAMSDFTALSDRLDQRMSALTTDLKTQSDTINNEATGALDRVAQLDGSLRLSNAAIGESGRASKETIEQIQNGINQLGRELEMQRLALLEKTDIVIAKLAQAKNGDAAMLLGTMESFEERLLAKAAELRASLSHLHQGAIDTIGRLESVSDVVTNFDQKTEALSERVERLAGDLQMQSDKLTSETNSALDKAAQLGGTLRLSAGEVESVVRIANEAVDQIRGNVGQLGNEIDAQRAHLIEKTDIVIEKLGQTKAETNETITLLGAMETLEDRLAAKTMGFKTSVEQLQAGTNDAFGKLEEVSAVISGFDETANRLKDRIEHLTVDLRGQTEILAGETNTVLDKAAQLSGALRVTNSDVETTSKFVHDIVTQTEEIVRSMCRELEGQRTALAETSEQARSNLEEVRRGSEETALVLTSVIESENRLGQMAGNLRDNFAQLRNDTAETSDTIAQSLEKLYAGREAVQQSGALARQTAEEALSLLNQHIERLTEASREAVSQAENLRNTDSSLQRDSFLNAAKVALDGLQSLSIDLTRVLDKDIPERVWRGLQRGDLSSFTKRLAFSRDHVSSDLIHEKFIADETFRNAVQTYMRQFEELLDQANKSDQSDLLSSTLMGSDVGKVYYLLAGAVGRERVLRKAG